MLPTAQHAVVISIERAGADGRDHGPNVVTPGPKPLVARGISDLTRSAIRCQRRVFSVAICGGLMRLNRSRVRRSAEAAFGPPTVVINNAGISVPAFFARMSEAQWRDTMDVNLDGVFRVAQQSAQRMIRHGQGGSIVNIASIVGLGAIKTLSAYAASKAAVIALTRTMALELAREKIRVNALAPGYISTELNDSFWQTDGGKRMIAHIPMRRLGRLDELDGPLLLLASSAGSFMTGSVLTVDGGHLLPTE